MMVLLTLFAFTFVLAQEQMTEDMVRQAAQEWQELFNQQNWDALAERYEEDAVLYEFDGRVREGRDAIRESLVEPVPGFPENLQIEVKVNDMFFYEDAYVDTGSWVVSDPDGNPLMRGNYMTLTRRENGEWRIVRQISNLELPEEMMQAPAGN